jgi:hypothetical protein
MASTGTTAATGTASAATAGFGTAVAADIGTTAGGAAAPAGAGTAAVGTAGAGAATADDASSQRQNCCSHTVNEVCEGSAAAGPSTVASNSYSSSSIASPKAVAVRPQSGKRDYFTLSRATVVTTATPDCAVGVPARLIIDHVTHQCSHR